jgi:hypothetical protein
MHTWGGFAQVRRAWFNGFPVGLYIKRLIPKVRSVA